MELGETLSLIASALAGGGITQIINWRINKRRGEAEVKNTEAEAREKEIDNMRKAMEDFYTPLLDKQNELIKRQDDRIAELEAEVKQLRDEKRSEAEAYARQISILQDQIIEISRALGVRAQSIIQDRNTSFHEKSASNGTKKVNGK